MGAAATTLDSAGLDNEKQFKLFESCSKLFEEKKGTLSDEQMCNLLRDQLNEAAPALSASAPGAVNMIAAGMKEEITLEFVLTSLLGNFYYTGWVFSPQGPGPVGGQLFGLIMEIQVFKKLEDEDRRRKRCKTILRRFDAVQLNIPALTDVANEWNKEEKPDAEKAVYTEMFDEALAEATGIIGSDHFGNFKKSPKYDELLKEMEENYKKKGNKQTGHLQLKNNSMASEGGEAFFLKKQRGMSPGKGPGGLMGNKYKPGGLSPGGMRGPGMGSGAGMKRPLGGSLSPQGGGSRRLGGKGGPMGGKGGLMGKAPLLSFKDCLDDKLGGHIFMSFCRQEGVEQNMLFCGGSKFFKMANGKPNALETICDRVDVQVDKFIRENSNLDLELDDTDRNDVLSLVSQGKAAEDKSVLFTVFDALVESRLSFLEKGAWKKFMVSQELKSWQAKIMKRIEQAKASKEGEDASNAQLGAGIDLNYVLGSTLGEHFFNNWVFSSSGPGPAGADCFGLIMEIFDFKKSRTVEKRQKRCQTILTRFKGDAMGNIALQTVQDSCAADKSLVEDIMDSVMFDEALDTAEKELSEKYFSKFKLSDQFKEMCNQVQADKRRMLAGGGMKKQEDRSSELTFGMVIGDKLGLHFFKQFCRQHCEEATVIFHMEYTFYKKFSGGDTLPQFRDRAGRIMTKYITGDANGVRKFEIVISDEQRKTAETKVAALDSDNYKTDGPLIFDDIYEGRFKYMEAQLWPEFQDSQTLRAWSGKMLDRIKQAGN